MRKRILSAVLAVAVACQLLGGVSVAAEDAATEETVTEETVTEETATEETEALTGEEGSEDIPSDDAEEEQTAYEEGNPDYLFQAGGLSVDTSASYGLSAYSMDSDEDGISLLSERNLTQLSKDIYKALKNKDQSIDVSSYNFYYDSTDDRQELLMAYYAVVNDNPELYYVRTGYGVSYNAKTYKITKIKPLYYTGLDDEAFAEETAKAKSVVNESMNDFEKVIALHDYIVLYCEYDKERLADGTMPKQSYGAYGVFVNHMAVCQGYALAFKYLMNEFDIECYVVTSDIINHAWNIVKLNGKYYQLDATWDDPTWDKYGLVSHKYLLKSDTDFISNHSGGNGEKNWYVTEGTGVVEVSAEDNTYDDYFWGNINSPLVNYSHTIYYAKYVSGDSIIAQREVSEYEMGDESTFAVGLGVWHTASGTSQYYTSAYSGLSLYNSKLYYNTENKIMCISLSDKTKEQIFELDDEDNKIYGMLCDTDGSIYYVKNTSPTAGSRLTRYKVTENDESGESTSEAYQKYTVRFFDVDKTTLLKTEQVNAGEDATPPDNATVPEGYKVDSWSPSCKNVNFNISTYPSTTAPITYTISYELNGGVNDEANPVSYTVETDDIELKSPSINDDGKGFDGWYTDSGYTENITKIAKGSTGNITLYAKWENTYTVKFQYEDGKVILEKRVKNGESVTFPDYLIEDKAGYQAEAEGNYENVVQDEVVIIKYVPIEYEITYELNGGVNDSENPSAYTVETDDIVLKDPSNADDGKVFDGWYTDSGFTSRIDSIAKGSTGNITLYAKWNNKPGTQPDENTGNDSGDGQNGDGTTGDGTPGETQPDDGQGGDGTTGDAKPDDGQGGDGTTGDAKPDDGQGGDDNTDNKAGIWCTEIPDCPYTGKAITPDVKVYDGSKKLRIGYDYQLSYKNNTNAAKDSDKNAPTVVIKFIGTYKNLTAVEKKFTITPVDISLAESNVKIQNMAVMYNKKVQKPVPEVRWGDVKLTNKKNYKVTYTQEPKEPGKYTVTVEGVGNFTGTATTTLTIADGSNVIAMKAVKISKKIANIDYSPNGVTLSEDMITLKYKNKILNPKEDYEFEKLTYKNSGTNYVTIKGKNSYVGEITVSFKINGTSASAFKLKSLEYTGETLTPVVTDKSGNVLTDGKDYEINSVLGTETAGTAKVSITGIGSYYGTVNKTFKVTAHSLKSGDVTVSLDKSTLVNGNTKPNVTVKYGSRTLIAGADYTLSYKYSKKTGTGTVTVKGKKNFKDSVVLQY
jgi:uncharacterized repeat protein (TIGR02543 family)